MDYKTAKYIFELQQKVTKIRKKMENTIIESEIDGIVVVLNGNMECIDIFFDGENEYKIKDLVGLFENIKKAINKGVKEVNKQFSEATKNIEKDIKKLIPNK